MPWPSTQASGSRAATPREVIGQTGDKQMLLEIVNPWCRGETFARYFVRHQDPAHKREQQHACCLGD